jgi:hypothetical protein
VFFKGLEKELFEMSNSKRFAHIRRKEGLRGEREKEKSLESVWLQMQFN